MSPTTIHKSHYFQSIISHHRRFRRAHPHSLLRLTSASPGSGSGTSLSGSIEGFAYDLSGNRTNVTRNLSGSTYSVNSLDEYTSTTGSLLSGALLSDANGNIIADSMYSYSYDAMNHLIEVRSLSGNTLIASYTYDGLGRRTTKYVPNTTSTGQTLPALARTTSYISSGDTPIGEVITNGSGAKVNQVYIFLGLGEDEVIAYDYASGGSMTGTRYYPITDHLGSVIGIINASRTLMERYIYDSYGKPYRVYGSGTGIGTGTLTILSMDGRESISSGSTSTGSLYGNTRLYTGRYYDREIGLSYHRARYYDPALGRFMGRDPLGQRDQVNLFTYVGNSPLIFVEGIDIAYGRTSIL